MLTWRDYRKAVWEDSFARWDRGQRITMFAGVVLGSLLLGVFVILGVSVAFTPEAGLWVSAALLLWMFVLVFIVSPCRLWMGAQSEISALKDQLRPSLDVSYEATAPYKDIIVDSSVRDLKGRPVKIGRIHRIKVTNRSPTQTIYNVRVCIREIVGWDHAYPNAPLKALAENDVFDLNPDTHQFVDVFASFDGPDVREFMILYANAELRNTLPRDPKEICIQAQGNDTPSVTKWVRTGSTPGGKLTIDLVDEANRKSDGSRQISQP